MLVLGPVELLQEQVRDPGEKDQPRRLVVGHSRPIPAHQDINTKARPTLVSGKHGTDHSTAGLSAETIGRNDAIFRKANEEIDKVAEAALLGGETPFLCECADMACHEIIFLTLAEYDEIRQDARWFLNVPGHQASAQGWAQVIARHDSYVVVEKIGPAGEVAEQLEGSSDPQTAAVQVSERYRRDDPV